jgi:formiminotetrahydrofolate cyclodeaminase
VTALAGPASGLERQSAVPLYRQVLDILRDDIVSGRLASGGRLATEAAMMARFGVSRTTVRQTIAALRKEGLVSVRRGKGTFVGRAGRRAAGLESETVDTLLSRMASGSPAPGGGAAAALTAAAAAALVAMVARVTLRHGGDAALAGLPPAADEARRRAVRLLDDDVAAYQAVVAAYRVGGPRRDDAVHRALLRATEVPLELARAARDVLALAESLAPGCRRSARSDLDVAATLAAAALDAAAGTVRTNLRDLKHVEVTARIGPELDALVDESRARRQRLARLVGSPR